jgi:hypothetical protein
LNGPDCGGANLTTTSSDQRAGMVNELPDSIVKPSPLAVAVPVKLLAPLFHTLNVASAKEPGRTTPKSHARGLIASAAGTLTGSNGFEPNVNSSKFVYPSPSGRPGLRRWRGR